MTEYEEMLYRKLEEDGFEKVNVYGSYLYVKECVPDALYLRDVLGIFDFKKADKLTITYKGRRYRGTIREYSGGEAVLNDDYVRISVGNPWGLSVTTPADSHMGYWTATTSNTEGYTIREANTNLDGNITASNIATGSININSITNSGTVTLESVPSVGSAVTFQYENSLPTAEEIAATISDSNSNNITLRVDDDVVGELTSIAIDRATRDIKSGLQTHTQDPTG